MKRIASLCLSLMLCLVATYAQTMEISGSRKFVRTSTDVIDIAMPAATLGYVLVTKDWQGLKQGALTTATAMGATLILKYSIKKTRPDFSDTHSFPSGHTAIGFANAAFLQRRYGWKVGIPAYALAAYVGWGRTYARKHDFWDVLAGAAIGVGSAYIYTRPFAKDHQVSITPISDGRNFAVTATLTF